METSDAIIIGAGPAGLACAVTLRKAGLAVCVLEKATTIGSVWRRHYDRLHLHTDRGHSGLPGLPMPRSFPKYPSRAQFLEYLEAYAAHFGIAPTFGTEVERVRRENGHWRVEAGTPRVAPIVVVATGTASAPYRAPLPGLETFRGDVVHSNAYRNPEPYIGKRTLVIGFGNSGGEIALDLSEAGVDVTMAVRGPIQILPRDLLGLPILTWAIFYAHLPDRLVDALNAPVLRLVTGRVGTLGLTLADKGARQMIAERGRVPLIDIGTLGAIRAGKITVRGAIAQVTPDGVAFREGDAAPFEAIVLATGYRPDLRPLLPDAADTLDAHGLPRATGRATGAPGLFFCGHTVSPTGQLREIGIEAQRIAGLARTHIGAAR